MHQEAGTEEQAPARTGCVPSQTLVSFLAQGRRPVTLIGFSLGARVIYFCLQEMAQEKGESGLLSQVKTFPTFVPQAGSSGPGVPSLMYHSSSGATRLPSQLRGIIVKHFK